MALETAGADCFLRVDARRGAMMSASTSGLGMDGFAIAEVEAKGDEA